MKSLKVLFIIGIVMVLSCSDDESTSPPSNEEKLVGVWELIQHENINDFEVVKSPATEEPILLNFLPNLRFIGNTQNNEFEGRYSNLENDVELTNFVTTAVSETDWGIRFYSALAESTQDSGLKFKMAYLISSDTLFLQYNQASRMVFVLK